MQTRLVVLSSLIACSGAAPPATQPPVPTAAPSPVARPVMPAAVPAVVALPTMTVGDAPGPAFKDPERRKKLEAAFPAIDKIVEDEMKKQALPGIAIGVVIDGELAYAKGFG